MEICWSVQLRVRPYEETGNSLRSTDVSSARRLLISRWGAARLLGHLERYAAASSLSGVVGLAAAGLGTGFLYVAVLGRYPTISPRRLGSDSENERLLEDVRDLLDDD